MAGKDVIPTPEHRRGFFATGVGDFADVGTDFNAPGYDFTTGGFLMGVDYLVRPGLVVGVVGGYARSDVDYASGGNLTADTGKAGVYATAFTDRFHADFYAGGGYNSYDSRRNALAGTASADAEGGQFDTFLSTGYDFKLGPVIVTPFVDVHYTYVGMSDFEENGSLAPLDYPAQNINSLRTAFGAAFKYRCDGRRVRMTSEFRAAWQHEYLDNNYNIDSTFAFGGPTFGASGPVTGRDALLLGLTLDFQFAPSCGAYLTYDAQIGRDNYSNQSVSGGVRINF
jgi:outer membrane autotransporter protein